MGEEESDRHREEEVGGKQGEKKIWSLGAQQCKALEVLCNSAAPERQVAKREKEPKDPHLKNHSLWCFPPCALSILKFSQNLHFAWS